MPLDRVTLMHARRAGIVDVAVREVDLDVARQGCAVARRRHSV